MKPRYPVISLSGFRVSFLSVRVPCQKVCPFLRQDSFNPFHEEQCLVWTGVVRATTGLKESPFSLEGIP